MKRADQKRATRQRLLDTARHLFRSEGFEATTLARVARGAGVAVGTVCLHFPNKSELVAAAFHQEIDAAIARGAIDPPADPVEGLLARIRPLLEFYAETHPLGRALLRESLFLQSQAAPFREQVGAFVLSCQRQLDAAAQAGLLSTALDTELAATGFFADYFLVLISMLQGDTPPDPDAATAQLRALTQLRLSGFLEEP